MEARTHVRLATLSSLWPRVLVLRLTSQIWICSSAARALGVTQPHRDTSVRVWSYPQITQVRRSKRADNMCVSWSPRFVRMAIIASPFLWRCATSPSGARGSQNHTSAPDRVVHFGIRVDVTYLEGACIERCVTNNTHRFLYGPLAQLVRVSGS